MNYRFRRGMNDLTQSPTTWDTYDWTIAGLVGFALLVGWSAMKSATRRLR